LEVAGWLIWCAAWSFENKADGQKRVFFAEVRKLVKDCEDKGKLEGKDVSKEVALIRQSTMGYKPFNGPKYSCWTLCRHPNYFGEWSCWLGFVVSAIPSALLIPNSTHKALFFVVLFYTLRMFYDCLVHWTGAGPAEHFSGKKRGKDY
jgi:steroid 5-alpha reductase family enzyme